MQKSMDFERLSALEWDLRDGTTRRLPLPRRVSQLVVNWGCWQNAPDLLTESELPGQLSAQMQSPLLADSGLLVWAVRVGLFRHLQQGSGCWPGQLYPEVRMRGEKAGQCSLQPRSSLASSFAMKKGRHQSRGAEWSEVREERLRRRLHSHCSMMVQQTCRRLGVWREDPVSAHLKVEVVFRAQTKDPLQVSSCWR